MFVNRTAELAWLEARWRAKDAQLLIVYGKRRAGKTALLKEFLQNQGVPSGPPVSFPATCP